MNDGSSDRDDIRNAIISPLFLAIIWLQISVYHPNNKISIA
jgi:hypothetical protein